MAYRTFIRKLGLWLVLLATAALAVLSVVGAFLGAERAGALFNSTPLIAFWAVLGVLLLAGLLAFKRLLGSPGLLCLHLGPLLILIGAGLGSRPVHELARRRLNRRRVRSGYMMIEAGQHSNLVLDRRGRPIGRLPFSLQLRDFWIEYYPPRADRWRLLAEVRPAQAGAGRPADVELHTLDWRQGRESAIPGTGASVRVLERVDRLGAKGGGFLRITPRPGHDVFLPARAGEAATLADPPITVRIVKTYSHLKIVGEGPTRRVLDEPGSRANPAVRVEITHSDGRKDVQFVLRRAAMHPLAAAGVRMDYLLAQPPAVKLLVRWRGREKPAWLIAPQPGRGARLSLGALLREPKPASQPAGRDATEISLRLAGPPPAVSDFKSHLVVLEEGRQAAQKVIEVNRPLHYGGYHFYQFDYDKRAERYTVLAVRSDTGLPLVYLGFFVLGVGVFWRCWLQPGLAHLIEGLRRGNEV